MDNNRPLIDSNIPELELLHRGKVRDVYAIDDDRLLLVATDRLSAFDCVLPTPIEHKGAVLTTLSVFWFSFLADITPNHLITADLDQMPELIRSREELRGRTMLVKRTKPFSAECVVRGYLEGSGWKDYKENGTVCGHSLPPGLKHCDRLLSPIFTPSTKAATGHDENITQLEFVKMVGHDAAAELKARTLAIYKKASAYALSRGIIIADTKFEFGIDREGDIILIDEALTPDSSRFWDASSYEPGHSQPSFDKQFVREYLETLDWDKTPPAPPLPPEVAAATSERYLKAFELLTGRQLVQ
ncbi:MAG: phosphoribosylaminoimidazolesuccinocarboxamide synthase [Pyrinomonadaceae bacterium]|nr:phosphoribosylaminoimidazolesuccinocarboxamide synthase [Pyrinomonadaceae bacterium]